MARPTETEALIGDLIRRADNEAMYQHWLYLLAASCLETPIELNPKLKIEVQNRIKKVVPPKNITEAKALASAGELVVPYLTYKEDMRARLAAACVRTLALVGDESAMEALQAYRGDARASIQNELVSSAAFVDDPEEYARRLFSSAKHIVLQRRCPAAFLRGLLSLESVELNESMNRHIKSLLPLASLPSFSKICISFSRDVPNILPLSKIPNFTCLEISPWSYLLRETFSQLAPIPNLLQLDLSDCWYLSDLAPVARFENLSTLNLSGCVNVRDLSPLARLKNLTRLKLRRCTNISDLSPVANLKNLRELDLFACGGMMDLSRLEKIRNLTHLNIGHRHNVDLSPLANLCNLTQLDLEYIYELSDLSPLTSLRNLTRLNLSRCARVRDLSPLARLSNLTELNLNSCTAVSDLSPLLDLPKLSIITLSGCRVGIPIGLRNVCIYTY